MLTQARAVLPLWARVLLDAERRFRYWERFVIAAHEETVLSWVSPNLRDSITIALYDDHQSYLAGGVFAPGGFFEGLSRWEEDLFTAAPFPSQGRVLLGAAGAGRELEWLSKRGFEVLAFEPSDLARAAQTVALCYPEASVVRACYRDLVRAVESEDGPLAGPLASKPFDAVILGWGSLSHVWDSSERVQLLSSLRAHSPSAPVAVSFRCRSEVPTEKTDRFRFALRRVYSFAGAPGRPREGLRFVGGHGFGYFFTRSEIEQLASDSGYCLDRYHAEPYPHALLVPKCR